MNKTTNESAACKISACWTKQKFIIYTLWCKQRIFLSIFRWLWKVKWKRRLFTNFDSYHCFWSHTQTNKQTKTDTQRKRKRNWKRNRWGRESWMQICLKLIVVGTTFLLLYFQWSVNCIKRRSRTYFTN